MEAKADIQFSKKGALQPQGKLALMLKDQPSMFNSEQLPPQLLPQQQQPLPLSPLPPPPHIQQLQREEENIHRPNSAPPTQLPNDILNQVK